MANIARVNCIISQREMERIAKISYGDSQGTVNGKGKGKRCSGNASCSGVGYLRHGEDHEMKGGRCEEKQELPQRTSSPQRISSLTTVPKKSGLLCAIRMRDEWERVKIPVDSGAS